MIYLDHAATTYVHSEVLEAMLPWLHADHVGNPSSIHTQGITAASVIEKARAQVAQLLGADPSEIYFTSGGTESNNAWLRCIKPSCVITSKLEHHSVSEPLFERDRNDGTLCVNVNSDGVVDLEHLETLLYRFNGFISAVSIMWVNNELGSINPIKKIGNLCRKYGVVFHTDAVQAVGHIPINVHECGVDMLSLSGHKFGAPPGIGALYISNQIHKKALIFGGGQERGMRGGTLNTPGIVGLGVASEIAVNRIPSWMENWSSLRALFIKTLEKSMTGEFQINGGENISPNILSLTIPGIESESLLLLLDQRGIYVSAGSACSAASKAPSHVLTGIGLSKELASSTVRISFGVDTTSNEVIEAAEALSELVHYLKSLFLSISNLHSI